MIIHSNLSKMKNKFSKHVYKETTDYGMLGAERVNSTVQAQRTAFS